MQSNIPVVGVANDTSPQSFDVSAQQGLFAGMAVALQKKGCKNIGQVIDEGGESYGRPGGQSGQVAIGDRRLHPSHGAGPVSGHRQTRTGTRAVRRHGHALHADPAGA